MVSIQSYIDLRIMRNRVEFIGSLVLNEIRFS